MAPWVNGVKTGHTFGAGYVLVGSGRRKGVELISVVIGAPTDEDRFSDNLAPARIRLLPVPEAGADPRRRGDPRLRRSATGGELPCARAARASASTGIGTFAVQVPRESRADPPRSRSADTVCRRPARCPVAPRGVAGSTVRTLDRDRRWRPRRDGVQLSPAEARRSGELFRVILTVTLNAAIDRTVAVPNFRLGRRHRAVESRTVPGGKGINVARALSLLGRPVIATGFVGGPTGTPRARTAARRVGAHRLHQDRRRDAGSTWP